MAFSMMKTPLDYDRYLDEYKANLQLQINNNAKIYNAVSQVQQGIQIPEAPPDMRSLSEKISDIQSLKNQLSILLRQLTDGENANDVVNSLGDEDLARAVQYFPALAAKLKSSYSLGVPSDVFIQALKNYSELQDENAGIDMGLQGLKSTSDKILVSLKNIVDYGLKPASIMKLTTFGKQKKLINSSQTVTLDELEKILLNLDDLERIYKMPLEEKNEIEKQLSDIYPKLPTQQQFENAFARLDMIEDMVEKKDAFDDLMRSLSLTAGEIGTLRQYRGVKPRGIIRGAVRRSSRKKSSQKEAGVEEPVAIAGEEPEEPEPMPITPSKKAAPADLSSWENVLAQLIGKLEYRKNVLREIENAGVGEFKYNNEPISFLNISMGDIPNEEFKSGRVKTKKYWRATNLEELYNLMPKQEGKGIMRGRGLVQTVPKIKREKKVKAIRITGKIEKPNEYVPFGRYGIHRFKLNDGILMLRTKSNNTIPSLAPQKVSRNIVDILKQVIIGGIPLFESISSLDATDKELLHKKSRAGRFLSVVWRPSL